MFKSKNNFLFILLISIVTLVVLVVGAFTLYEDNSLIFSSDGYIIETTADASTKYYFSANTSYKENVDEMITFSDVDDKKRIIDPASFVHYSNGDVMFLKKGALVNLEDLKLPMVNYYNITNMSTINYENGSYVVSSNDKDINISSFVGRISDNKYLVTGSDLRLKIPNSVEEISGEYFELLFVEDGVLKISSEKADYQVTAQDSFVYIGNNIVINLVDGKILLDGEAKMLLSQITINGDENIDLDVDEDKNSAGGGGGGSGSGDGTGSGSGTGEGEGTDGTGTGEGSGGIGTGEGSSGTGTGEGTDGSGGGAGEGGISTTEAPQLELIEAVVTSTAIDLTMQLNNADKAKGNLLYYFTNLSSGDREGNSKYIDLVNGTFYVSQESLSPNTEYSFVISEIDSGSEKQYFQKTFRTKDLGITLEKVYATDSSLSYKINFDENTEVSQARISIHDDNGSNENIKENQVILDDKKGDHVFTGLKPNTTYSVSVDMIWIGNAAYSNVYSISRLDSTLKRKPKIKDVKVVADAEEVKFNIKLDKVTDLDKAIVSYVYNVYLADDVTKDEINPAVQYSVTKNDSDDLVLNLNEIDELNTGVDYRARIYALYNDNEMVREVSTEYSSNFLIRSKPKVSFEVTSATFNSVAGTLSLIDANCTVPMSGRSCSNKSNTITLKYYEVGNDESTATVLDDVKFNTTTLTTGLSFDSLKSNTTYAVKVFGNYIDDSGYEHKGVQLGDAFFINTYKSDNIYFEVSGDNKSGYDKDGKVNSRNVVNFDARLTSPNPDIYKDISTMTLNLYSGRYNKKDKLIGTYVITDNNVIGDFFNNVTITNSLFTDVTDKMLGKLDSLDKMISVTNNYNSTLNNSTAILNNAYTVEVEDVYDSNGINKFVVEDNIYTFNLTPDYYLDARIASNSGYNYVTVIPITKGELTDEEYDELSAKLSAEGKDANNLENLNDDTVVGISLENSLSDEFVNSAYTYEKVTVDYIICNKNARNCDSIINDIVALSNKTDDESVKELDKKKKEVEILSVDMGNKYQPKEQIFWLDSSIITDPKKGFIRGYTYKVGFNLRFVTKDGSNPVYTNSKLYNDLAIEKQSPIYTQYISNSHNSKTKDGITYSYMFNDVDSAIEGNSFYYSLGDSKEYKKIEKSLIRDGKYHDVTVPVSDNSDYTLYYLRVGTDGNNEYVGITNYYYENEVSYNVSDNTQASYELEGNNNTLRIKLFNDVINSRSYVYKVVISDKSKVEKNNYVRYFLGSRLNSVNTTDENGEEVLEYKYIDIDYAKIHRFMGREMSINVYAYFDSGLVGIDHLVNFDSVSGFDPSFVLKNSVTNKYLNTFNADSEDSSSSVEQEDNMGLYKIRESYTKGSEYIYIYNKLKETVNYNPFVGVTYYADEADISGKIGIKYGIDFTNNGINFKDGNKVYSGYNVRMLKEAQIVPTESSYKFNTIIPTIKVKSDNTTNTINSIKVNVTPMGIYGDKQIINNEIHVELFDSEEKLIAGQEPIATQKSKFEITGNKEVGYSANEVNIDFYNLDPATTYYFKVYGYTNVDGKKTKTYLYNYNNNVSKPYEVKTYETKTLDASYILKYFSFGVKPVDYAGEHSKKQLTWILGLNSTSNYKVRFELYRPKNGEYVYVNFDGSNPESDCVPVGDGESSNGYVNGCFISVSNEDLGSVGTENQSYIFSNDDFVFGNGYYKLVIYAIPYYNDNDNDNNPANDYDEDRKIVLYQNDSLSSVDTGKIKIDIATLEEPVFKLGENGLETGSIVGVGCYLKFKPIVIDNHKVIRNGKYKISVRDEGYNIIKGLDYGKFEGDKFSRIGKVNEDGYLVVDLTDKNNEFNKVNSEIGFTGTGLSTNSLYYIVFEYEGYRNNNGFSEDEKTATTSFTDFIYTSSNPISLGKISVSKTDDNTSIILTYNGASKLDSITSVEYTITLKGGSSSVSGKYDGSKLFKIGSNKVRSLTINPNDNNNNIGFKFSRGNTYIITTKYEYYNEELKKYEYLMNETIGNETFTTVFNYV